MGMPDAMPFRQRIRRDLGEELTRLCARSRIYPTTKTTFCLVSVHILVKATVDCVALFSFLSISLSFVTPISRAINGHGVFMAGGYLHRLFFLLGLQWCSAGRVFVALCCGFA